MSEQYPLLCDEVSEEECLSPHFHQRLLMSKVRARNHVNGAATIITRWPAHWTTSLKYWWMGLGMLTISAYILYSCIASYALLLPPHKFNIRPVSVKPPKLNPEPSLHPKVFMHIFVDDKQEVDLNSYLPYIEIITKKYKHLQYELNIVANDTNVESKNLSESEYNDLALNMLWTDDINEKKILTTSNNLKIKYISLSKYLYDSPLKKYFRSLPHQSLKFLVRALSIWEKGGIAFDPIVLTPQSPNAIYIDKICNILKKHVTKTLRSHSKSAIELVSSKKIKKSKRKPNNIRDIINALENENTTEKSYLEPLTEVETKDDLTFGYKLRPVGEIIETQKESVYMNLKNTGNEKSNDAIKHQNETSNDAIKHHNETSNKEIQLDSSPKSSLMPMLLNFLFHNKRTKYPDESTVTSELQADNQPKKNVIRNENKSLHMKYSSNKITNQNNVNSILVSPKEVNEKGDLDKNIGDVIEKQVEDLLEVTIDLKGKIIATDTPCHAFIGNLLSNAIHHDKTETVTEFIIKELSIFCKGLFAYCVGMDVILL